MYIVKEYNFVDDYPPTIVGAFNTVDNAIKFIKKLVIEQNIEMYFDVIELPVRGIEETLSIYNNCEQIYKNIATTFLYEPNSYGYIKVYGEVSDLNDYRPE